MEAMTIGKLAKRLGVGVETIRFYERKGLIKKPVKRAVSGFRTYDDETARRLVFIRRSKELGFSLREIKDLLSLKALTRDKCETVRAKAQTKLEEVTRKIRDLTVISQALKTLISSCQSEAVTSSCPILDVLSKEFSQ